MTFTQSILMTDVHKILVPWGYTVGLTCTADRKMSILCHVTFKPIIIIVKTLLYVLVSHTRTVRSGSTMLTTVLNTVFMQVCVKLWYVKLWFLFELPEGSYVPVHVHLRIPIRSWLRNISLSEHGTLTANLMLAFLFLSTLNDDFLNLYVHRFVLYLLVHRNFFVIPRISPNYGMYQ